MFDSLVNSLCGRTSKWSVVDDAAPVASAKEIKLVLETMVRHMVDNPDALRFAYAFSDKSVLCSITPASGDVGHLIGRQGRTADALRQIMRCVSKRCGLECVIEID